MLKSFFEEHAQEAMEDIQVNHELKHRLKSQLMSSNSRKPLLSLISNTMKRYSFAYLAGFAVLALVITAILPAKINPLSPEEVLAKALALENYENKEGIYHEEVLREGYINGQFQYRALAESYGDWYGNSLHINKNPKTKAIEDAFLTQVDQFGDTVQYSKQIENQPSQLSPQEQEWEKIFMGEKIYCKQRMETETEIGELMLVLAADDYSVYRLDGAVNPRELVANEENMEKMAGLKGEAAVAQIKNLIQNAPYEYSLISEKNKKYHLFKISQENQALWFYIDAQTYELSRYETHSETELGKMRQVNTILVSEFLEEAKRDSIFNPDRFGFKKGLAAAGVGEFSFLPQASGCYDFKGKKLDPAFIHKIPAQVKEEWENTIDQLEQEIR